MLPRQMTRYRWGRELKNSRLHYTVLMLFGHLAFGLINGTYAPTLVDLEYLHSIEQPEVTMKDISFMLTCFCLGVTGGSSICFLYKVRRLHLNRQLMTVFLVLLFSSLHVTIPWIRSLKLLYIFCFLAGLGAGNYNAVATTLMMEMWTGRKMLGSLMQTLSLMYGVGAILGPLITRPFVMGERSVFEKLFPTIANQSASNEADIRRHSLAYPFGIAGTVEGLFGILLLMLFILKPYEKEMKNDQNRTAIKEVSDEGKSEEFEDNKETKETFKKKKLFDYEKTKEGEPINKFNWPRWLFLSIMTLAFGAYNLCDIGYLTFMNTYMQKLNTITIDATRAAEIDSITATAYTFGRLVNILVTRRVPILHLLFAHYFLSLGGIVAMFWTRYSEMLLILNSIVIGYSFSATIPAMFTYVDSLITVNECASGFFFVALSTPSVLTPLIIGSLIDSYPLVMVWLLLGSVSLTIFLFSVLQILVLKHITDNLK